MPLARIGDPCLPPDHHVAPLRAGDRRVVGGQAVLPCALAGWTQGHKRTARGATPDACARAGLRENRAWHGSQIRASRPGQWSGSLNNAAGADRRSVPPNWSPSCPLRAGDRRAVAGPADLPCAWASWTWRHTRTARVASP